MTYSYPRLPTSSTMPSVRLCEMTDGELRAELARTPEETNRYDEIMAELEERVLIRRQFRDRALRDTIGWHPPHAER